MSQSNVPPGGPQPAANGGRRDPVDQGENETAASHCDQENAVARPSDVEQMETELRQAQAQILRAQADLENYRKRIRRDMDEQRKFADLDLMRDLLPVLDNFDLALNSSEPSEATAGLVEGVKMVAGQLTSVLQQHDCHRIDADGQPFDPNRHEAVAQEPRGDQPPGTVVRVLKPGYTLHQRVIRPAQVVVSTHAAPAEESN